MAGTWVFEDVVNNPLTIFLLQLALVLVLTRFLGGLVGLMKQPQVIGEIIAGVLLGPSVMGRIPGFTDTVFPTAAQAGAKGAPYDSTLTFTVVANTGLILFMFLMGLELDRSLLRKGLRQSVPMAAAAIAVPFAIGCGVATWLSDVNEEGKVPVAGAQQPSSTAFLLFAGASMTFTAFPVLASILSATGLIHAPIGVVAMSAAAVDDVVAWCVLAVSSSFAKAGSPINGVYTVCLSVAYCAVMVCVVRPVLARVDAFWSCRDPALHTNPYYFCGLMVLLIGSAYATEAIGIHPFFGAFLMGLITPQAHTHSLVPRMELVTRDFLLPLFFASSGIRTNIGTLDTARYWGITLAIILIATVAKFVPSALVTRLLGRRSWRFSATVGLLMNTRGLVEIIALNIGLSLGILSTRLFTMLVLMAIATTLLTSPLVWLLFLRVHPDGWEECDREALKAEGRESGTCGSTVDECAEAGCTAHVLGGEQGGSAGAAVVSSVHGGCAQVDQQVLGHGVEMVRHGSGAGAASPRPSPGENMVR
mmetsp:Transcript_5550/g.13807  ORF Transcript_5550/g.13807 Transcript_5550/m.13807 type:complete len:533 (-) Transcript_5550:284-1882(-)|eukprot:CAMPEP_0202864536 /NCGR_PEP_ID=MMETSP1391-20130828/4739_1 /ASSEMBLY_ACC=CAM_ASM_000867 /TAXON_ID=1034604 /ORGANISM="Chlamydomonas leiostraca, Strain SAG 11-49" /LENGTH=532 /DNA_ID=CAMNT_0049544289 /DNA_START=288 /DNA_END=1886 /DNA_ORIENTATION=+